MRQASGSGAAGPQPGDPAEIMADAARDPRLQPFIADGRIVAVPARRSRRLLLLDAIAQAFEPGVRYTEGSVTQFLRTLHPDYAALRRYLVDEGLLSRSGGEYWRSGGTVITAAP